jgi:sugar/nucleoside kinase (ribokinase family)
MREFNLKIIVVGSVALDTITTPFGKAKEALGGSATHFSCSASFFSPVGLVAVVGEDFPTEHIAFLEQRGVDVEGLEVADGETFRWEGYYEYDLNQAHTVDTRLNVFETFKPRLPERYREAKFLFLANIDPDLQIEVLSQAGQDVFAVCDTMNYWIERKRTALTEMIGQVAMCLMNDAEAREFCNTHSLVEAARQIMSLGPRAVVLKKGEHGALMFTDSTYFSAPALPIENIKDPTGAGDSFAGGFLGHLAATGDFSEANIRRAIIYGSVMASFNVEGFGVERLTTLTRDEIEARYRRFKEITEF